MLINAEFEGDWSIYIIDIFGIDIWQGSLGWYLIFFRSSLDFLLVFFWVNARARVLYLRRRTRTVSRTTWVGNCFHGGEDREVRKTRQQGIRNQEIWKETLYDEKLEIDKKKFIIGLKKSKWQKYCIIEINFKSVKLWKCPSLIIHLSYFSTSLSIYVKGKMTSQTFINTSC